MKCAIYALITIAFLTATALSQQPEPCPQNFVCISREAALKALADADRVRALEAEIPVKNKAIDDLKQLLADMRVEFARCSGETTILKQRAVSDAAMIELLTKLVRPKKIGLFNF
jgi:hypothetical protein